MNMRIRKATTRDAEALCDLNEEFNHVRVPLLLVEERLARNRKESVFVAKMGSQLVGYACLQYALSLCYLHPWAEVTEMYVRSHVRRKGIGTSLLRAVQTEAAKRGVDQIIVLTGEKNTSGQGLYASSGYRASRKYVYTKESANEASHGPLASSRP